jgi:hypothetical protein
MAYERIIRAAAGGITAVAKPTPEAVMADKSPIDTALGNCREIASRSVQPVR